MRLPDVIRDEEQLEDVLCSPSDALVASERGRRGRTLVIGAGGKMGGSLVGRLFRAIQKAGSSSEIVCASRFSDECAERALGRLGVQTIRADILDPGVIDDLPDADRVVYMAGRKFGTTGSEADTWALSSLPPAGICRRFAGVPVVALSTGSVYGFSPAESGGAVEAAPLEPRGEYANAAVARERVLEWASKQYGSPVCLIRLFYANDLRYGVLRDIADSVLSGDPVNLSMGSVNLIWQGDAVDQCLRAFDHATTPAIALNITGPETISVRYLGERLGDLLGKEPVFEGAESGTALLGNATRAAGLFGYPEVPLDRMIRWTAAWVAAGGRGLGKRTLWEHRNGRY
ncbi:MAG: NAD(P)-dependent oxidoreductase [Spirochaetaceae bacterium]|nr:MAG: NAD(P)-dependent oxidoreductase [Spirochaetaceae bacterium]